MSNWNQPTPEPFNVKFVEVMELSGRVSVACAEAPACGGVVSALPQTMDVTPKSGSQLSTKTGRFRHLTSRLLGADGDRNRWHRKQRRYG